MGKDVKDRDSKGSAEHGLIRDLATLLIETGLSEIEIEKDGLRLRVARQLVMSTAVATHAGQTGAAASGVATGKAAGADPAGHPGTVKSPMVGTAYRSPEPGAAAFIDIGSRVSRVRHC